MSTVLGWIELLKKAFPVDKIRARRDAKNRGYNPDKDDSVMESVQDNIFIHTYFTASKLVSIGNPPFGSDVPQKGPWDLPG
jgi:hypothetical protein